MFEILNATSLLYLDIETTPISDLYDNLNENYKSAWKYFCKQNYPNDKLDNETLNNLWKIRAALIPEFSMIICISIGEYFLEKESNDLTFKTWTRFLKNENDNENLLLIDVKNYLNKKSAKKLITHNGKDFDYAFMIRRFICNKILPPPQLQIFNKKPWEIELFDTKEIWKFGSSKSTSLVALCTVLNIPSPKEDIDGSMIYEKYYDLTNRNENMKKIAKYCSNDVRALALIIQYLYLLDNPDNVLPEIKYV
jgi:uncharacterized protein YprB with RNaseH-like and TPR domain